MTYLCNGLQSIPSTESGEGKRMKIVNFRKYNFWYVSWELYWSVKARANPTEIQKGNYS